MMLIIKNKKVLFVILVFILALAPRLFLAVRAVEGPTMDAAGYDERAMSIVRGEGFSSYGRPTSFKPPFYSVFLASIYLVFGHSYLAVRVIQSIMGAFTCILIFFISEKIFGVKVGAVSGLLAVLNGTFIMVSKLLYSENLFLFFICLMILLLVSDQESPNKFKKILIGVIAGLLSFTRTEAAFLLPFIFIVNLSWLYLKKRPLGNYAKEIGIIFLIYCITLLPWTVRNWRVHNAFVPFTTATGINLYSSYCPPEGKKFGFTAYDDIVNYSGSFYTEEVERSRFLTRKAIEYIKSNPDKLLRLEILKMAFYWSVFDWEVIRGGQFNISYGFMLPFFLGGIIFLCKKWYSLKFLYLPIIYFQLTALIFYGSPRFRITIEPFIIIFAAFSIVWFFNKFANRLVPASLLVALIGINFIIYMNSFAIKAGLKSLLQTIGLW